MDQQVLAVPISIALKPIIAFIRRHTSTAAEIGATRRKDIPQYLPAVIREAVVNALLHTDYSIKGSSIQIAIFGDRIEITNPSCLPFGLSFGAALSGIFQLRNCVIGRVFRKLNLIEQGGSGLGRMINICEKQGIPVPKFEELGNFFRTTLYHSVSNFTKVEHWQRQIIEYLKLHKEILPKKVQTIWNVSSRTTSSRLKKMCLQGILVEISTSPFDPQKKFSLRS
ncbi:ATP-binding protein [Candidatus Protochlamydia sp. W-9]|uniref:ATP-binding protein n=1 Tax=Candidatus Protochlamydia sp. W-9 TaxID=1785087 RepID=UPI0009AD77BB|nr:ATP-binding protein [Candidatus Protochlamydia sp. W-9]